MLPIRNIWSYSYYFFLRFKLLTLLYMAFLDLLVIMFIDWVQVLLKSAQFWSANAFSDAAIAYLETVASNGKRKKFHQLQIVPTIRTISMI